MGRDPLTRAEHDATGHALICLNGEADPARAVDLAQGAPAATLVEWEPGNARKGVPR
jgi:hypothetical protein